MNTIMDDNLKNQLISCDIVVWNGVVTRYGSIKDFVEDDDRFRVATPDEIFKYRTTQNNLQNDRKK